MNLKEFRRNFPPLEPVPHQLVQLLEFQNRSREWYSGYFELTPWRYGDSAWFVGDEADARQFVIFGRNPDGSLYSLWLHPGDKWTDAPVVFLGSEGTDCGVLSGNLNEFLGLLAVGSEELGFAASWGNVVTPDNPTPRLQEFRDWLQVSFGISAPPDPLGVITAARKSHPEFGEWLQNWQQQRD
jgi:hypothetical protein